MSTTVIPNGMTYRQFKVSDEGREAFRALATEVKREKVEKHRAFNTHDVIAERWAAMCGLPKPAPIPLATMPTELVDAKEVGPNGNPSGDMELKVAMPDFPEPEDRPRRRGRPPGSRNKPKG